MGSEGHCEKLSGGMLGGMVTMIGVVEIKGKMEAFTMVDMCVFECIDDANSRETILCSNALGNIQCEKTEEGAGQRQRLVRRLPPRSFRLVLPLSLPTAVKTHL